MKIYARIVNGLCVDVWRLPSNRPSPGAEWTLVTEEELAALPQGGRIQKYATLRDRLTPAERQALFQAVQTNWMVADFVNLAVSAGEVHDTDPNFPAAVQMLDQLGILAASRWDALMAP